MDTVYTVANLALLPRNRSSFSNLLNRNYGLFPTKKSRRRKITMLRDLNVHHGEDDYSRRLSRDHLSLTARCSR